MKALNQPSGHLLRELLGISETDYNNLVLDSAVDYLNRNLLSSDTSAKSSMLTATSFWKWWVNQFERRNSIIVYEFGYTEVTRITRDERFHLREVFDAMHSVHAINVWPNRIVIEETYAIMMGEVLDEVMKGGVNV
jgi:hypothetical protein